MGTVKSTQGALLKQALQPSTDHWSTPVGDREGSFNSHIIPPSTLRSTSLVTRPTRYPGTKPGLPSPSSWPETQARSPSFPAGVSAAHIESLPLPRRQQSRWLSQSSPSRIQGSLPQVMHRDTIRALTAIVFSLIPPTGRIFPVNDTSPVMATFCLTGQFMASDSKAVTIVHPALGPSFGVAPCLRGKKKKSTTSPPLAHPKSSKARQHLCHCCFNTAPGSEGHTEVVVKVSLMGSWYLNRPIY